MYTEVVKLLVFTVNNWLNCVLPAVYRDPVELHLLHDTCVTSLLHPTQIPTVLQYN